jgi:hypothetical protein
VEWGVANGITDGANMTGDVTREQVAAILYRYAKLKQWLVDSDQWTVSLGTKFRDAAKVSEWAADAMSWANAAGILTGRAATELAPGNTITRAEAAAFVRFILLYILCAALISTLLQWIHYFHTREKNLSILHILGIYKYAIVIDCSR